MAKVLAFTPRNTGIDTLPIHKPGLVSSGVDNSSDKVVYILNPEKAFGKDNIVWALVSNFSRYIMEYWESLWENTCLMTELNDEYIESLEELLFDGIKQLFELHYSTWEFEHSCISISVCKDTRKVHIYYDENDCDILDISLSYDRSTWLVDIVLLQDGQEIERIHDWEIQ